MPSPQTSCSKNCTSHGPWQLYLWRMIPHALPNYPHPRLTGPLSGDENRDSRMLVKSLLNSNWGWDGHCGVASLSRAHGKAAKAGRKVERARNKEYKQRSKDGGHRAPEKRTNTPAPLDVKDFLVLSSWLQASVNPSCISCTWVLRDILIFEIHYPRFV